MRVRPPDMEPVWDGKPMRPENVPERRNVPETDEAVNERLRKEAFVVYSGKISKEKQK